MVFVDGENFAIRAKDVFQVAAIVPPPAEWYEPDTYLWLPTCQPLRPIVGLGQGRFELAPLAARAYFYTSVSGDTDKVTSIRRRLRALSFEPAVFKKPDRNRKAKGVDIALSKDLLSHGFHDNYDVAVLVAGDGDYLPLIEEVKRLGRRVCVAFFRDFGLNDELTLQADAYFDLTIPLLRAVSLVQRPSPGHPAECDACHRREGFSPGLAEFPAGWRRLSLAGFGPFTLCERCARQAGAQVQGELPSDPVLRAFLSTVGVNVEP